MKSHLGCLVAGGILGYGAAHHAVIALGTLTAALFAAYSLALWLAMSADSQDAE